MSCSHRSHQAGLHCPTRNYPAYRHCHRRYPHCCPNHPHPYRGFHLDPKGIDPTPNPVSMPVGCIFIPFIGRPSESLSTERWIERERIQLEVRASISSSRPTLHSSGAPSPSLSIEAAGSSGNASSYQRQVTISIVSQLHHQLISDQHALLVNEARYVAQCLTLGTHRER